MSPVRVLVAEDNEDHRFFAVRALKRVEGVEIEVEGVADGQQTLDYVYRRGAYADRALPHLIFLDLKMPKVDGLAVLETIKGDPDLAPIPVVVLSSSDRPEDIEAAYRNGTNSYVTKPTVGDPSNDLKCVATYWTSRQVLPGLLP